MAEIPVKVEVIELSIPDDEWQPNPGLNDPLSGLAGPTVIINGLPMHMEAWQVVNSDEGQEAVDTWAEEYFGLRGAVHAYGAFQTLTIGDREYVVVLSPHCD